MILTDAGASLYTTPRTWPACAALETDRRRRPGTRPRPRPGRDPHHQRGVSRPLPRRWRRVLPHAAQAIKVVRRRRARGSRKWTTVTVYAITSLTAAQADPVLLARWLVARRSACTRLRRSRWPRRSGQVGHGMSG